MTVTEILRNTDKTLFSFEVLPPLRGKSIEQIYKTIDRLIDFNPAFIEITTHRNDYVYKEVKKDIYKRVEERLRPGTVAIAYAIKQKYNIPVVPHIICSGYSQQETENELFDLSFLDILDLLVLRGDKSKQDSRFIPKEGGLHYASELCQQINDFNNGKLVYGGQHELPHQFSYGVCTADVVAPPTISGIFIPASCMAVATVHISSRLGVMSPDRHTISTFCSFTVCIIVSVGTITPRSITSNPLHERITPTMFFPMS